MTAEAIVSDRVGLIPVRSRSGRLAFLDGLRGLAATQVVSHHYLQAFLPGLGMFNPYLIHYDWELAGLRWPWFFISDGAFWINLFFIISGAVLTTSQQERPLGLIPSAAQRLVKLGGPMVLALVFSAMLLLMAPQFHVQAASLSGSALYLGDHVAKPGYFAEIVHQALSSAMLSGYRDTSLLPRSIVDALGLDPISRSLNSPLWTLHIEFWGSLFVLSLTTIRRRLPGRAYAILVALLAILLSRHAFLAFLFGHLFVLVRILPPWRAFRASRFAEAAGLVALLLGIVACANPRWGWMTAWFALPNPVPTVSWLNSQGLYAAIVFFVGVVLFTPVRAALHSWPLQWLGRNSFGLYLVHFPILFTVSSATFVALHERVSYGAAVLGASAVGVPLSFAAAAAFTAWVNPAFVRLGRAVTRSSLLRGGQVARTGEAL